MQMVDGALSGGDAICRIDLAIGFQLVGPFFPPLRQNNRSNRSIASTVESTGRATVMDASSNKLNLSYARNIYNSLLY